MKSRRGKEFDGDLLATLLEEQQNLTAVERFSREHEASALHQRTYSALMPLSVPGDGEQFAFSVDLQSCTGCKACVTACHSLNGLDEGESWRQVGTLSAEKGTFAQQTITSSCHHCLDPACLDGCPVLAYDKDPVTGIVRHLDDQCIGCQYCVLTCPYQVPQYSSKRGIVRKCDMCSQRLAVNEAPACVQACPNGAIAIQIVTKESMRSRGLSNVFLPDSPPSSRSFPTTTYNRSETIPLTLKRTGRQQIKPNHFHAPLILMLVLSQAAAGALLLKSIFATGLSMWPITIIAATGAAASAFHLGRPAYGWRAFLGWRKSWLSREVIAYGVWLCLLTLCSTFPSGLFQLLASVAGCATVYTSIRVYQATRHAYWNGFYNAIRFAGTSLVLGAALQAVAAPDSYWPTVAAALILFKVAFEIVFLRHNRARDFSELNRSARLIVGPLNWLAWSRVCAVALAVTQLSINVFPMAGLGLLVAAELCERALFFAALAPEKMPSS